MFASTFLVKKRTNENTSFEVRSQYSVALKGSSSASSSQVAALS